mmetsp:Transcript_27865/g.32133  ORF Transcript_27865/g.32133 Transcript_27865/m.32133 type:complete len:204 (+) Transcript_27865:3-614(+)
MTKIPQKGISPLLKKGVAVISGGRSSGATAWIKTQKYRSTRPWIRYKAIEILPKNTDGVQRHRLANREVPPSIDREITIQIMNGVPTTWTSNCAPYGYPSASATTLPTTQDIRIDTAVSDCAAQCCLDFACCPAEHCLSSIVRCAHHRPLTAPAENMKNPGEITLKVAAKKSLVRNQREIDVVIVKRQNKPIVTILYPLGILL